METPLPYILSIESRDEDSVLQDSSSAAITTDPIPTVNLEAENPCASVSTPRPSYTPQFSSASWLLDRIKNAQGPANSNLSAVTEATLQTKDEGKNETIEKHDSSMSDTLPMPISPTHQPFGRVASMNAVGSQFTGTKRKRDQADEMDDFTQNTMSLPIPAPKPASVLSATETLSVMPQVNDTRCRKCYQGSSDSQNPLIPCNDCSRLWHQGCVPLTIKKEEAQQPEKFTCPSCVNASETQATSHLVEEIQHQKEIERRRAKNLAALPDDVVPAKARLVGFWAGQASDAALTEYFYGKKKTDVLNILSFCDQLKPQLLVDIMVSVARKHPDLPIFDSPDWNAEAMSAISARTKHSHQSSRSTNRPRHGHTVLEPRPKHKHKVSRKTIKITSITQTEESPVMDYRDSLPPMWPKAGEGMYAKLSPEDEDRAFLLDENDEEAFSHFEVDKFGKQIAIPVSA
ncbi:hypothetical protein TARUN_8123 [Trichoderma arundinaceum]|uniref:PHD-type domain-containing protein n=1 Tax=Trichoderma arundinaceum TaxID=490622 RepID=A0A395NEC3_TRIAR|nr:hypothetical protein TARUN_8123 [Trichoderma arundinaceum]